MMINRKCTLWTFSLLLLTTMAPAVAQQTDNGMFVVPANHSNRTIAEIVQTTWVIENAELEQQIQGDGELKNALTQLIPGPDVNGRSCTNCGMNVCSRLLIVLVDGVRLNSSRTDNRQLDSIDPFNIDHIEVISGATSLHGNGSIGGLINIVTKKGQPKTIMESEADTKSGFGSSKDHDERIAGAVSGRNEHVSGCLSVAYQESSGWLGGDGDATLLDNIQANLQYSDRLGIMGTGTLNINESRQLQLTTWYYKSQGNDDYGLNFGKGFSAVRRTSMPLTNNGLNFDRIPGTERHLISLQYSDSAFLGQELVGQIYCRDEPLQLYPSSTVGTNKQVMTFSSSQQGTNQYGMKLTLNSKPMNDWQITWGLDTDHERFTPDQMFFDLAQTSASGGLNNKKIYTTGHYPPYDTTNPTAPLQSGYDINNLFILNNGVRYWYIEDKIDDFTGYAQRRQTAAGKATSADAVPDGSVDYDNFLFNAGLLMHITERRRIWFSFSQSVELPNPGKYYGCDAYGATVNGHLSLTKNVNVSDSKLEGVRVDSCELGWRLTGNNLCAQIAAYYSISDKSVVANKDLIISVVDDKRRICGVEGAVGYLTSDTDWSTGVDFNVLKTESKVNGTRQKYDVKTVSPSEATTYIGWASDPQSLRMQSTTSFGVNDTQGYKVDGYTTVDLLSSYQPPVDTLSFNIENLFDRDCTTVWGQCVLLYCSPGYDPASLYDYKGKGRALGLNYSMLF